MLNLTNKLEKNMLNLLLFNKFNNTVRHTEARFCSSYHLGLKSLTFNFDFHFRIAYFRKLSAYVEFSKVTDS